MAGIKITVALWEFIAPFGERILSFGFYNELGYLAGSKRRISWKHHLHYR